MSIKNDRRLLVLGCGAWGTALAIVLRAAGHEVNVWGHEPDYSLEIEKTRRNPKFLPDVEIPDSIRFSGDIESLVDGVSTIYSVVPTQFLRGTLEQVGSALNGGSLFVSCSKGFEAKTQKRPSEIIEEQFPNARVAVLSGPSHAEEVCRYLPATLVAASASPEAARDVQQLMGSKSFRLYTSGDPIGVEVGGATKNVIAIACGISDGLGFGINARAGLMTRGLREMTRLGCDLGAQADTFAGLSGMGDLVATCCSSLSRNWTVGSRVGKGELLDDILASTEQVAEGVNTTKSLADLATRTGTDLPITRQVYEVLFRKKPAREAVESLMTRESKQEAL